MLLSLGMKMIYFIEFYLFWYYNINCSFLDVVESGVMLNNFKWKIVFIGYVILYDFRKLCFKVF